MTISSRTPEGEANRCPLCGLAVRLEPSRPPGDAPCPCCGNLLWFGSIDGASDRKRGPHSEQGDTAPIRPHDRVRVTQGTFAAMEGRVDAIAGPRGPVPITITIFGRPVPVELEASQVELVS